MHKTKHNLNSRLFVNAFTEIGQKSPTSFPKSNFKQPKIVTKATSFVISSEGSKIWNNYLPIWKPFFFFFFENAIPLFLSELKHKL